MMGKIARVVDLIAHEPSYLLGRFHAVRATYSGVLRARQAIGHRPELKLGERFRAPKFALQLSPSGYVVSHRKPAEHVRELRQRAWSGGIELTAEACAELTAHAKSAELDTKHVPRLVQYPAVMASPELRNSIAMGTVTDSSHNPVVKGIAGDPAIVEPVRDYLGYFPERVGSWLFWSFANALSPGQREGQYETLSFHYDVHGFNFMYVNFYLTDTDPESGAHVLIEGTHRHKALHHLFGSTRMDDDTAVKLFGAGRIRVMDGNAGSGFFEDTMCYHKALPPRRRDRLMLQLRYE